MIYFLLASSYISQFSIFFRFHGFVKVLHGLENIIFLDWRHLVKIPVVTISSPLIFKIIKVRLLSCFCPTGASDRNEEMACVMKITNGILFHIIEKFETIKSNSLYYLPLPYLPHCFSSQVHPGKIEFVLFIDVIERKVSLFFCQYFHP